MNKIWIVVPLLVLGLALAAPAWCETVAGVALNAQGQPVSGLEVTVEDMSGKVIGQSVTDASGKYTIDGISMAQVQLVLSTQGSPYKPGSGVTSLTKCGATINWRVSDVNPALAIQEVGCDPPGGLGTWDMVALGATVTGAGVATGLAASGVLGGSDHGHHHGHGHPVTSSE